MVILHWKKAAASSSFLCFLTPHVKAVHRAVKQGKETTSVAGYTGVLQSTDNLALGKPGGSARHCEQRSTAPGGQLAGESGSFHLAGLTFGSVLAPLLVSFCGQSALRLCTAEHAHFLAFSSQPESSLVSSRSQRIQYTRYHCSRFSIRYMVQEGLSGVSERSKQRVFQNFLPFFLSSFRSSGISFPACKIRCHAALPLLCIILLSSSKAYVVPLP